jgi:hypothetical protein
MTGPPEATSSMPYSGQTAGSGWSRTTTALSASARSVKIRQSVEGLPRSVEALPRRRSNSTGPNRTCDPAAALPTVATAAMRNASRDRCLRRPVQPDQEGTNGAESDADGDQDALRYALEGFRMVDQTVDLRVPWEIDDLQRGTHGQTIEDLGRHDPLVFDLLTRGRLEHVFQIEQPAIIAVASTIWRVAEPFASAKLLAAAPAAPPTPGGNRVGDDDLPTILLISFA